MVEPNTYVAQLKPYGPSSGERTRYFRYDFNENILGPPPEVVEALRNIDPSMLSMYPEYVDYYERISSYLGIYSDQLLLVNGTDEGIKQVLETYMIAGDGILLPEPTFTMYRFYSERSGFEVQSVLLNEDLSFPTQDVMKRVDETTRIIVLVNPNNPTGIKIERSAIELIIKQFPDKLVLVDEAYYEFNGDSAIDLANQYDNVVVLRTFSKSLGLAGLRIGMVISNPKVITTLKATGSPFSVSAIAAYLATVAIRNTSYIDQYVNTILQSRWELSKKLKSWGFKVYPSDANFILVDFGMMSKVMVRFLKTRKILVRDRSNQPLLKNCVRITIGGTEDTQRLIEAVDWIRSLRPLIFDMDGVLVDASQSYRMAISSTVTQLSSETVSMKEIDDIKLEGGYNNDWEVTQELIRRKSALDIELADVINVFQSIYLGNSTTPGLIENEKWLVSRSRLESLRNRYPLFIFTGRPKQEALVAVKNADCESYFDGIVTMDDIPEGKTKPNPWGIETILYGFNQVQGWYLGDNVDDMRAAACAGITAIGIIPPNSRDISTELKQAGAITVTDITNFEEFL